MTSPYPCGFIGDGITRAVILALPSLKVRTFLPAGLELGEQDVTPRGTHPVILLFHEFSHCQWSFPTFLRSMDFNEQTVGVPFTYIPAGDGVPGSLGPYYFMPKLYLDDLFVLLNGMLLWGFDKQMAMLNVTAGRYTVTSLDGQRLASLEWSARGNNGYRAIAEYPEFEPIRQMLSQTLISVFPAALGPFFVLTEFDRRWTLATVRPLRIVLEVDSSYMPAFDVGRYPPVGWSEDVNSPVFASYELLAPWWLSFPYQPMAVIRRSSQAWYS